MFSMRSQKSTKISFSKANIDFNMRVVHKYALICITYQHCPAKVRETYLQECTEHAWLFINHHQWNNLESGNQIKKL